MRVEISEFGHFYNQAVQRYCLHNDNGMSVSILTLGGIIQSLRVPDADGHCKDVVLGYDKLSDYTRDPHYFGALIGRVANRIEGASYHLGGRHIRVDANAHEGRHCVHGGRFGYHRRVWQVVEVGEQAEQISLVLRLIDEDGEEGFANRVCVYATYVLDNRDRLSLSFAASADGLTPVSLTAHSYFNLAGHDSGTIGEHRVQLHATQVLAQKADRIPSGERLLVAKGAYDFSSVTPLADMVEQGLEVNHSFPVDDRPKGLNLLAQAWCDGRRLRVFSDEKTLHFYNGHNLDKVPGKHHACYPRFAGLCFEPKGYVNGVNQAGFPCTWIDETREYQHNLVYDFGRAPEVV